MTASTKRPFVAFVNKLGPYAAWVGHVYDGTENFIDINKLVKLDRMMIGQQIHRTIGRLNIRIDALRLDEGTWEVHVVKNGDGILGR